MKTMLAQSVNNDLVLCESFFFIFPFSFFLFKKIAWACKPGSVVFYHQSRTAVTDGLYQPTPQHRTSRSYI